MKKKRQGYPLIRQRTSRDPISVTNFLRNTKIRLEIKATKEDWNTLNNYFHSHGKIDKIGAGLVVSFLSPVQVYLNDKYREDKNDFIQNMQMLAGILYSFFFYCFKNLKDNLPDCILKIRNDQILKEAFNSESQGGIAIQFTVYCMQIIYGELLEKFKLNPFNQDLKSFEIRYIQKGKNFIKDNYDNVIYFWCYSFLIGRRFKGCNFYKMNKHVINFIDILKNAFLYRKNTKKKINKEVISIHNILLKIFPWLSDIDNIFARLRWDNPSIEDDGFVELLPSDEIIQEYRKKHIPPAERISI